MITSQELLVAISNYLKPSLIRLSSLSVEGFISFVEECQREIVQLFQLEMVQIRRLDASSIHGLLNIVREGNGGQFIFRHGEQEISTSIANLDEKHKKIIMMQLPHNETAPITINSAVEYMGTILTMAYLKTQTGCSALVDTSSNLRAKQPAETLARILDLHLFLSAKWKCINYPEDAISSQQLDAKGNLAWDRSKVDAVVGAGSFDRITVEMQQVLAAPVERNTIQMIMTHTQQFDEFYVQASGTSSTGRLTNYGFVFRNCVGILRSENGFYSKDILLLQHEPMIPTRPSIHGIFGLKAVNQATDEVSPRLLSKL